VGLLGNASVSVALTYKNKVVTRFIAKESVLALWNAACRSLSAPAFS